MAPELSLHVSAYAECAQELIDFRNANRDISRDRAYFDWRYRARPCRLPAIVVWAESAGRRVGALTLFPHDYYVLDGEYPLGVLGDISVLAEYRGAGVARRMFEFLPQVDAVRALRGALVLPNEPAARPLAKSGWRDATRVERYAKALAYGPRLVPRFGPRLAPLLAAPLDRLLRILSAEGWYRRGRWHAALAARIDTEFDELWRRAEKRGRVIGVRDARYLRWRYQDHPLTAYRMLAISDGDALCGYAMYRLADGVCFVDDVFCREPRHAAPVIALTLLHVREQHADVAAVMSVSVNRSVLDLPWRRFGFLRRADSQRVMTSDCGVADGALSSIPGASWHVMAGDKDV